jgi:hypothetical protein
MADRQMEERHDMQVLEEQVTQEIEQAISRVAHRALAPATRLTEIQPPKSVTRLAAETAAKVIVAFERGTRIGE